jgi:hypothetical protein
VRVRSVIESTPLPNGKRKPAPMGSFSHSSRHGGFSTFGPATADLRH